MLPFDPDSLRRAAKQIFDADVAKAGAEYEDTLRVVEKMIRLIERQGELPVATPTEQPLLVPPAASVVTDYDQSRPDRQGLGPTEAVRQACRQAQPPFMMPQIYDALIERFGGEAFDKTAISSALNKLRKQREIEVVREAFGRTPALYTMAKLKGAAPPHGDETSSAA